jgi:hypothetical protein
MEQVYHKLTPIKDIGEGWYKLRWKPIKNGTYNLYWEKTKVKQIGIKCYKVNNHSGFGKYYDGFAIEIRLYSVILNFWIHYNYMRKIDRVLE